MGSRGGIYVSDLATFRARFLFAARGERARFVRFAVVVGVWRVAPSEYDPSAKGGQGKGGRLYPCLTSPPMLDFDSLGNVYVPQDGVDTVLYIDRESGESKQLTAPGLEQQGDACTPLRL